MQVTDDRYGVGFDWGDVLAAIDSAFAGAVRPDHFTNYTHCCECADADEFFSHLSARTLAALTDPPETLPLSFLTNEAFHWFMPGIARMLPRTGSHYCVGDVLFHVENRLDTFAPEERAALRELLYNVYERLQREIEATPFDYPQIWRVLNALDMTRADA